MDIAIKKKLTNGDNKGVWFKGYVFPVMKMKYSSTNTQYHIDSPRFNKGNYDKFFKGFVNKMKEGDLPFKNKKDALNKYYRYFLSTIPTSNKVGDDGLTIKEIRDKHNQKANLDKIIIDEFSRIEDAHPKSAPAQTKDFGSMNFANYNKALQTALTTTANVAEEGKAKAEEGKAKAEEGKAKAEDETQKTAKASARSVMRATAYGRSSVEEQAEAIQYAMADSGSDEDRDIYKNRSSLLRQRVKQLEVEVSKKTTPEGFVDMTYSSFQQLVTSDFQTHSADLQLMSRGAFATLFGEDGQLKRAPTNKDLAKYRLFHNTKLSEHKTKLQPIAYKVDATDPMMKRIDEQYKLVVSQKEKEYQQHQKALLDAQTEMTKMLADLKAQHKGQIDAEREANAVAHIEAMEDKEETIRELLDKERRSEIIQIELAHKLDLLQRQAVDSGSSSDDSSDDSDADIFDRASLPIEAKSSGENVSLVTKEQTGAVIDPTGSSGLGSGADVNSHQNSPAPAPQTAPAPAQPLDPIRLSNLMTIANRLTALRQQREERQASIAYNISNYRRNEGIRLAQIRQEHDDFINNVGVQSGIETPAPANDVVGVAENTSYGQDQQESTDAIAQEDAQKQDADYDTKTDAKADVSKFGYGKQVSKYAKQQGRDFTYTMTMVQKSKNAPSQDATQRKAQKTLLLMEWGDTIGIKKAKGNSYEECLEIYTIVFLAEDLYRMERNYKKALIKYLPLLKGLSHQSNTNTQLGIITASQNPMTMEQADELIRQTARQRRGRLPRPPSVDRGRRSEPTLDRGRRSEPTLDEGVETKGADRRRLGGFNTEMAYSGANDYTRSNAGTDAGQSYTRGGVYNQIVGGAIRQPNRPSGVQGVRQIVAQLPKPPKKMAKRDGRPKMNIKDSQFRMRKSRINPNLLFVNLDKQNPNITQEMPTFRPRLKNKEIRRIKF